MNNKLYGISGSINSGKDLVGTMLLYIADTNYPSYEEYDTYPSLHKHSSYAIKKCADKLKDTVCIILGCTREQLEDEVFKNTELGPEWWVYRRDESGILYSQNEYDILTKNEQVGMSLVKLTPRMILQLFGTQGGRMIVHPNIWVNSLFAEYHVNDIRYHYYNRIMGIDYRDEFTSKDDAMVHLRKEHILIKGLTKKQIDYEYDELYKYTITEHTFSSKWIITDVRFPENEGVAVAKRNGLLIGIKRHFALKHPEYAFRSIPNAPYAVPAMLMNDNEKLYKSLMHESETSMGDHSWCDVVIENNGTIEELFNNVLEAVK